MVGTQVAAALGAAVRDGFKVESPQTDAYADRDILRARDQ